MALSNRLKQLTALPTRLPLAVSRRTTGASPITSNSSRVSPTPNTVCVRPRAISQRVHALTVLAQRLAQRRDGGLPLRDGHGTGQGNPLAGAGGACRHFVEFRGSSKILIADGSQVGSLEGRAARRDANGRGRGATATIGDQWHRPPKIATAPHRRVLRDEDNAATTTSQRYEAPAASDRTLKLDI